MIREKTADKTTRVQESIRERVAERGNGQEGGKRTALEEKQEDQVTREREQMTDLLLFFENKAASLSLHLTLRCVELLHSLIAL